MSDHPAATRARRQAFAEASPISEAMIQELVHAFYGKIRTDPALGPIFNRVIAEGQWPPHLAKMCDFWSSVTLMSGRFKGSPMQAHLRIGELRPTHFSRWLHLFEQTARQVCPPDAAAIFVEKSQMIARSLQMGLQLARGEFEAAVEHDAFCRTGQNAESCSPT
jgi:hemoglobin